MGRHTAGKSGQEEISSMLRRQAVGKNKSAVSIHTNKHDSDFYCIIIRRCVVSPLYGGVTNGFFDRCPVFADSYF